ncbi:AAA family ATPase [Shewanella gelidimarina]|uniref:McrB family protein n=1 Tax=Shewanella gelidimarina TaxID=56813 RepID=UPI00200FD9F5|nr:AAA family ATPase [Shewanella gelidimarina]MCL1058686.1 AAA family ATPase [Shewanella gelidimarina]
MPRDNTKYQFNGQIYGKGQLVLAVMTKYIEERSPTFKELVDVFGKPEVGTTECVISLATFEEKLAVSDDVLRRYFKNDSQKLRTKDGVEVLVNSQWGIGNIRNFVSYSKKLGFEVLAVVDGETLLERFSRYKDNPDMEWIVPYRECCNEVAKHKISSKDDLEESFILKIWKHVDAGFANVSPGFLSEDEYTKLFSELSGITVKILESPTSKTLEEVYTWAKKSKSEGNFNSIKWGVIHRVFAAADPIKLTTVLNEEHIKKLAKALKSKFDVQVSMNGNWLEKNINLKTSLANVGIVDDDPFIVNTFIWQLYIDLVVNEQEKQVQGISEGQDSFYESESSATGLCLARNIIFYGPPGTGKTFKLQKLLKNNYSAPNTIIDESLWLNQQVEKLSWFEVVLLILIDIGGENGVSDITKHKFFLAKLQVNGRESNFAQTAWAALQTHTIADSKTVKYDKRTEPLVFDKTQKSQWFIVEDKNEQLSEYVSKLEFLNKGPTKVETVKRYEFVTFHQSYGYEEFVEGLRPETNDNGDISYSVKPGVFKRISKLAKADPEHRYAIVIDEINRGNISKVFGELISLIEVDKRTGTENALFVTLPYSGELFSVPANLDIIGSMNTADRSLTHIDVALRRRFEFKELRTDYSLLANNVEGVNVRRMLFAMNQRIELLLDREHIIGHALLMKIKSVDELSNQFKTAILPLLEEYFFEDWEKISQVLNNNGMIQEQENARSIWLGSKDEYAAKVYSVNQESLKSLEAYTNIYAGINDLAFSLCDEAGK